MLIPMVVAHVSRNGTFDTVVSHLGPTPEGFGDDLGPKE